MTLAEDVLKTHQGTHEIGDSYRCLLCCCPHPCPPYRLAVMVRRIEVRVAGVEHRHNELCDGDGEHNLAADILVITKGDKT